MLPDCWTGKNVNYHSEVGKLLDIVASAIRDGKPVSPKLAKYACDILEGRFVPLAKGMNACSTGFPEVCDVAFDFAGIPTWIARDKEGTFAFRGFGPDGGHGSLVEIPKNWHVELVHGIENDVPVVAWPKTGGEVFDVRWNGHHRLITDVRFVPSHRSFALWKDRDDRRFVAAFGQSEGRIVCLDDPSLDRRVKLDDHLFVRDVVERGGRAWIFAHNFRTTLQEVIDDRGETLGTGPENCVDVVVRDGTPTIVRALKPNGVVMGERLFETTDAYTSWNISTGRQAINSGRSVFLVDKARHELVDALGGTRFLSGDVRALATLVATDGRLFMANTAGQLTIYDRESGIRLYSAAGLRMRVCPLIQFGDDVCVAFENGCWHVFYGEDDTEWDTGIPSTDPIQLLPNHRAATWKFVDGTLYTRVVKCDE